MLATLIVVFREMMEAGLIVGIVLAATRGVPHRNRWVAYGIGGGVVGACLVAAFANTLGEAMQGAGQEWFNVAILLVAVCMLTWHNVWMARHGREIAIHMKAIGHDVAAGKRTLAALAIVVGVAVLREGSETVLFLYGIAIAGTDSTMAMATGAGLGLAIGAAVSALMYGGLLRIRPGHLFRTTSGLISLLAAGMAAQAVFFLQQAQIVTVGEEALWDSSGVIANSSIAGKVLHTLVGYTDHPTGLQLAVYAATLAVIYGLMRLCGQRTA